MKLCVLSALIFVVGCQGAPHTLNEYVGEDDLALNVIAGELKAIEKLSGDSQVAKAVIKSIDHRCMLEAYKKHKLLDGLTEESFEFETLSEEIKIDPILVFGNIAFSCSSKLNSLLGFVFDNVFSYSGLLDAFREDEPFKKFIDDLNCYNNYAVKTEVLDPNVYSHFNYQLVNITEAECDEDVVKIKETVAETLAYGSSLVISDHSKCLQNELALTAEKFTLRYFLLIPLGLNEEQKKMEKINFINDAKEVLEKLLKCNAVKETPSDKM